jgi:hypothetical protein
VIGSLPFSASFVTTEATFESNERSDCSPVFPEFPPPQTVWYRYTATRSVTLSVDISATVDGGNLGIYRGDPADGFAGLGGSAVTRRRRASQGIRRSFRSTRASQSSCKAGRRPRRGVLVCRATGRRPRRRA